MISIFRAMATIAIWVLFIWGIGTILISEVRYWVTIGIARPPEPANFAGWALGTAQLTLSVVCMRLRQKLG